MLGVLPFVEDPDLSVSAARATSATLVEKNLFRLSAHLQHPPRALQRLVRLLVALQLQTSKVQVVVLAWKGFQFFLSINTVWRIDK